MQDVDSDRYNANRVYYLHFPYKNTDAHRDFETFLTKGSAKPLIFSESHFLCYIPTRKFKEKKNLLVKTAYFSQDFDTTR